MKSRSRHSESKVAPELESCYGRLNDLDLKGAIPMPATDLSVMEMRKLIKAGLNVLLVGPSGVGKTLITREAVQSMGLKLKVLNAPTLDPYAHLIGIPVPDPDSKDIDFRRPVDIREAEVLFIDEANRASDPTLNALMEITQFKSINGEALPNLRCIIAAMNPPDGDYKVNEIDLAIIDRFDAYFDLPPAIDAPYFTRKYGSGLGGTAVKFWRNYENSRVRQRSSANKVGYLSPRKLERILDSYIASGMTSASIPPKVTVTASSIRQEFGPYVKGGKIVDPNKSSSTSTITARKKAPGLSPRFNATDKRKVRTSAAEAKSFIASESKSDAALDFVRDSIANSFSPQRFTHRDWQDILDMLGRARCRTMYSGWSTGKQEQLRAAIPPALYYSHFN